MKIFILAYTVLLAFCLGITSSAYAQKQPSVRADKPSSHTVVKGDTLWDISAKFLKDPWSWPEIWQNNRQIANPHLIYPGDIIRLIFVDGKPLLTVNGDASNNNNYSGQLPTIKLSPRIRSEQIKTAIPIIPLGRINAFLSSNRIVEAEELENAPYIIAGEQQRIMLGTGDKMYSRGQFSDASRLDYGIYSKGKEYLDPISGETIGVQAVALGTAKLIKQEGEVGTLLISHSLQEIGSRSGNRLLPNHEREIVSTFLPNPPETEVEGLIVNSEDGLSQVGRLDVVTINIGERDGLNQGNILGIYKVGGIVQDTLAKKGATRTVVLPDERAGLLMIIETFEKMSFAIVLESDNGVSINDRVANP